MVFPDCTHLLFCLSEKCSDISKPENGTMVFSTDGAITYVDFKCYHGYSLTGPSNISCIYTGKWDQEVPNCGNVIYKFIFDMKKSLKIKIAFMSIICLELFDKENFVIEKNCKAVEHQILFE